MSKARQSLADSAEVMAPSMTLRSSAGITSAEVIDTAVPPSSFIISTCSGFQERTFMPLTSSSFVDRPGQPQILRRHRPVHRDGDAELLLHHFVGDRLHHGERAVELVVRAAQERQGQHVQLGHVTGREADRDVSHLDLVGRHGLHDVGRPIGQLAGGEDGDLQPAIGRLEHVLGEGAVRLRRLVVDREVGEEAPLDRRLRGSRCPRSASCRRAMAAPSTARRVRNEFIVVLPRDRNRAPRRDDAAARFPT
jgi:hypothetical protein